MKRVLFSGGAPYVKCFSFFRSASERSPFFCANAGFTASASVLKNGVLSSSVKPRFSWNALAAAYVASAVFGDSFWPSTVRTISPVYSG